MSPDVPSREAIAERHHREHVDDTRDRRRFWIRVILLCWLWAGVGLVLAGLAFHTTDVDLGHIYLYAGQLVTLVGVLATLGWALVQSEKRGWR